MAAGSHITETDVYRALIVQEYHDDVDALEYIARQSTADDGRRVGR